MRFVRSLAVATTMTVASFVLPVSADEVESTEEIAEPDSGDETSRNYVDRTITLRKGTLRVDAAPADFGLMDSGAILGPIGDRGAYGFRFGQALNHMTNPYLGGAVTVHSGIGGIGIGAAYGLSNGFEVGALLLPLYFDGSNSIGNIAVYGRGRLSSGDVSTALQVTVSTPTGNDLGIAVGIPINVHVDDHLRLEIGIEAETLLDVDGNNSRYLAVNADVPFAATWKVRQAGFIGGRTGVTMTDIGTGNRANDFYLPVGAHGGYSFDAGPMLLDIKLSAQYTFVFEDTPYERPSSWLVMLGANGFFDF